MQAFDWRFLPFEGSLLDQPDALMDDLVTIGWRKGIIEKQLEAGKQLGRAPGGYVRRHAKGNTLPDA